MSARAVGPPLADIAEVYLKAAAEGPAPCAVVASTFGISPATAARRVERARAEGLIPPGATVIRRRTAELAAALELDPRRLEEVLAELGFDVRLDPLRTR